MYPIQKLNERRQNMEKNTGWIVTVFLVMGLLVGGLVGVQLGEAQTETVIEEVSVTEYVNVPTIVNQTVEVEKVERVFDPSILIDEGLEEFLEAVDDDDAYLVCGDHEYDFDEISVMKVYDDYTITGDDEDTEVAFVVKLKYDEEDERSCKETYDVEVYFEEDEDPEVTIA